MPYAKLANLAVAFLQHSPAIEKEFQGASVGEYGTDGGNSMKLRISAR